MSNVAQECTRMWGTRAGSVVKPRLATPVVVTGWLVGPIAHIRGGDGRVWVNVGMVIGRVNRRTCRPQIKRTRSCHS